MSRFAQYRESINSNAVQLPPELVVRDADTLLLAVDKSHIQYNSPVDDPMFSAHQSREVVDVNNAENFTIFTSDTLVSVLGCTEQVRTPGICHYSSANLTTVPILYKK